MGKKDAKAKTAEKKARVTAKASKKASQKEKKTKGKGKDAAGSSDEDVDLEAVLKSYAEQQAQFLKVTENICDPPSARTSSTLLGSPTNNDELFLFGGEHYNGALATFFNDLYVYNTNRAEWRHVTSPNSPLPRSGHAWTRGGNDAAIYLFGGEFSSPKQGTFYHYNDFWRLDTSTREWSRIETKGQSPSARSGHRMSYFKNYIILFGGFQDTSQTTKYLSDMWIFDTRALSWHAPALPPASQRPDARSSFSLLPHDSGAVLYGGYSRVKVNVNVNKQQKVKAGKQSSTRAVLKPQVHQDTWLLRISSPATDAPANTLPVVRWEKRKRPVNSPQPARAGAAMAYHKGRGICFGGVHDVEESEEGIESEFFDQLFAYNIDRNRFFQLMLRRPRATPAKGSKGNERGGRRGRGKADEEELLKNLARLETKGGTEDDDKDRMDWDGSTLADEREEGNERQDQPVLMTMPHPRFNAALAVQDDVLYIYGGTFERGDQEYTFDEMYAVDLGKLDGMKEIFRRELADWEGSEDGQSESDEDEEGDEDEDMSDAEGGVSIAVKDDIEKDTTMTEDPKPEPVPDVLEEEEEATEPSSQDSRPHPRPFESLRDFYARTSDDWQKLVIEAAERGDLVNRSVKEIKKEAFERAEGKWWDVREEITALEDEQEEAGIGEVISIADRANANTGGAKRR